MTRKVTALRFRKRLLPCPTGTSYFRAIHVHPPHIIRRNACLTYNNRTHYRFPISWY